jgi:hypothetical protein
MLPFDTDVLMFLFVVSLFTFDFFPLNVRDAGQYDGAIGDNGRSRHIGCKRDIFGRGTGGYAALHEKTAKVDADAAPHNATPTDTWQSHLSTLCATTPRLPPPPRRLLSEQSGPPYRPR